MPTSVQYFGPNIIIIFTIMRPCLEGREIVTPKTKIVLILVSLKMRHEYLSLFLRLTIAIISLTLFIIRKLTKTISPDMEYGLVAQQDSMK